jgi:hypothetical protein
MYEMQVLVENGTLEAMYVIVRAGQNLLSK